MSANENCELFERQAQGLPEGWVWRDWDDGSGSLRTPDGDQFVQYDAQTKELRYKGKQWEFFDGYPYKTESLASMKERVETHVKNMNASEKTTLVIPQNKSARSQEAR